MLVVVALGGNALLRRGEAPDPARERTRLRRAVAELAAIAREHALVVTHGNGPQVGLLALQAAALPGVAPTPLDLLGAESEGLIGALLVEELAGALPGREIAALLTLVEVAADDPAFARPDKPIGPVYGAEAAARLAAARGWTMAQEAGGGARRVVASPRPRRIRELASIRRLVAAGTVVVCAGGGGVPVVVRDGRPAGVEAVIDKDRTAALLALGLDADALLLLTDVDAVYEGFGGPAPRALRQASPDALAASVFAAGSMGPKVEAACDYARAGRGFAAIGALEQARAVLEGRAGTRIDRGTPAGPA